MPLYLVATPIGNLADMTERAVTCLRECDAILAEDTRRALSLLRHLGIEGKPVDRFDANVEHKRIARCLERLAQGDNIALVSDAGTPTVSDPGAALVTSAIAAGIDVRPIPGVSAVTTAIAASGFGGNAFRFFGFLPRRGAPRHQALQRVVETSEIGVLFESPSRVAATLAELAQLMPERPAMIAREMTKRFEEFVRGTLTELSQRQHDHRGEFTIVLGPYEFAARSYSDDELRARASELSDQGMRSKEIAKVMALETGLSSTELYRLVLSLANASR